jgi:hypothetical protein
LDQSENEAEVRKRDDLPLKFTVKDMYDLCCLDAKPRAFKLAASTGEVWNINYRSATATGPWWKQGPTRYEVYRIIKGIGQDGRPVTEQIYTKMPGSRKVMPYG